jgi:hypothetical protein
LRRSTGVVAWWSGPQAPHPSAARLTLAFTTRHPVNGTEHVERCGGWALAVGGAADVFVIARAARAATLLDLETGDWVRTSARRSGFDVGTLSRQEEVTTVDAAARGVDASRVEAGSSSLATIVREEAIYDQEWCPWDATRVRLFQNFSAFSHHAGAPRNKQWGLDSNLSGSYGIPQGYRFEATGVTLELRDADGRAFSDPEFVEGSSSLRWSMFMSVFITWPLGSVLRDADEGEGFVIQHQPPPAFPLAFPIGIQSLEQFSFDLERPLAGRVVREGGFFAKVIVSGFMWRGQF